MKASVLFLLAMTSSVHAGSINLTDNNPSATFSRQQLKDIAKDLSKDENFEVQCTISEESLAEAKRLKQEAEEMVLGIGHNKSETSFIDESVVGKTIIPFDSMPEVLKTQSIETLLKYYHIVFSAKKSKTFQFDLDNRTSRPVEWDSYYTVRSFREIRLSMIQPLETDLSKTREIVLDDQSVVALSNASCEIFKENRIVPKTHHYPQGQYTRTYENKEVIVGAKLTLTGVSAKLGIKTTSDDCSSLGLNDLISEKHPWNSGLEFGLVAKE